MSGPLANPEILASIATRAEDLGFKSAWVGDHIVTPAHSTSRYPYGDDVGIPWEPDCPWLDPILSLTWVAAATTRLEIGTSVLILPLRPPLLVAKQLATLDVFSGGRLTAGFGSGWLQEEFSLLGQEFDDRGERMVEAIPLLRRCWAGGTIAFSGNFYRFDEFCFFPAATKGRIPILIGGEGDVALRRVAAAGDGWNPLGVRPHELRGKLRRLAQLLEQAGRSLDELRIIPRPGRRLRLDGDLLGGYERLGMKELILDIDWRFSTLTAAKARLESLARSFL